MSREIGTGALVVAFLGAPTVWALHLAVSYFLVSIGCGTDWAGAKAAVLLATVIAAAAAMGFGAFAWQRWRWARGGRGGGLLDPERVREFLALSGVVLAALFVAAIIMSGISPLFLPLCTPARS